MEELLKLLKNLQDAGAPTWAIKKLEQLIERRALRIKRHDAEVQAWQHREQETRDKNKGKDWLILFLLLLMLESDNEDDEFTLSDMLPAPRRPTGDPTGFLRPTETEPLAQPRREPRREPPPPVEAPEPEELDDERTALASPKW